MGYAFDASPRNAPSEQGGLRSTAMKQPRRPTTSAVQWPEKLLKVFAAIEWPTCKCPQSLMSVCLVGQEQGCWTRRRNNGVCDCKERWLPSCLQEHKHGCVKRRLGQHSRKLIPQCRLEHPSGCYALQQIGACDCERVPKPACDCQLVQMPCCMAAGCHDRQLGHLCDCPRGPSEACPHMDARHQRVMIEAFAMLRRWYPQWNTYDFWAYLQRQREPEKYAEPEAPGVAEDMSDRETAVAVMEFRQSVGVGLRHPKDRRAPDGEKERVRLDQQLLSFGRLFAIGEHCRRAA